VAKAEIRDEQDINSSKRENIMIPLKANKFVNLAERTHSCLVLAAEKVKKEIISL
jgi:hypothetical protein